MKLKSELILSDLRVAIERHKDSLQAEEFRISWIAITTLLRAVGHVLDKVDSLQSPKLKRIIGDRYLDIKKTKPKPEIFWYFIDNERNRFIKEYDHNVDRGITLGPLNIGDIKGISLTIDVGRTENSHVTSPTAKFKSIISSGHFKGRNEKDVAIEALSWWTDYINSIKDEFERTQ